ncbi:oxidoreductase [Sporocytophaga myxococcoides]|uniref:Oxidoreductase n=1 Tax=Sporocytophaga myxococcoides TaxID=153721 RepID=A0A098LHZ0_9BACT|nr:NAD(P)H-binding protein [Sporocytophaga myxococcoides]GAL86606.1 oxidoreductase [Sporocytophaga myxococcoides]
MQKGKTALIFGATGLVGKELTGILINDERYDSIKIFGRHSSGFAGEKVKEIITELNNKSLLEAEMTGDHVFCCLGTTIKKAKTKEAFRKVDLGFPKLIAEVASATDISKMIVISSIGASTHTSNFYLKTKGEMEETLTGILKNRVYFLRPSFLLGNRSESRPGEQAGKFLMKLVGPLFRGKMKKYRAIEAHTVAEAMVHIANEVGDKHVFESDEIIDVLS